MRTDDCSNARLLLSKTWNRQNCPKAAELGTSLSSTLTVKWTVSLEKLSMQIEYQPTVYIYKQQPDSAKEFFLDIFVV